MRTSSKFGRIDFADLAKGFLVAAIAPFVVGVEQFFSGNFQLIDWNLLTLTSLGAGISYLIKNFFTPSQEIKARKKAIGGGGIMNPR